MNDTFRKEALEYHEGERPGKTGTAVRKPIDTSHELALAYTPGVAEPAKEIDKERWKAYRYTNKGNLVAVISNGSAVLGLGNIGALASKPVMEGKAMLFKRYADIDAFDIEISDEVPDRIVETIQALAPTFGGINLEDIKAPGCFEIEEKLRALLDIPVMHDDQHGTAVTIMAALINTCIIKEKNINTQKIVICGAGAAGISTARMLASAGVKKEQITIVDSQGVISRKRTGLPPIKMEFAATGDTSTLPDAMEGADIFIGLSRGNILKESDIMAMNSTPAIFALANPTPEIDYNRAKELRPDAIICTGRSDYPNQINNLLAFPYLFRGALDTYATTINNAMMIAAAHAIATVARNGGSSFGKEHILPKPGDRRLLTEVSSAVAEAAMKSGVARRNIASFKEYRDTLISRTEHENFFGKEHTRHHNRKHPGNSHGRMEEL
ncbi:MAG: malate dehydrogenase [Bacteroidaceae bacterium]|nr:malate dehydrogenase [Bacteroidaceae bacterium]